MDRQIPASVLAGQAQHQAGDGDVLAGEEVMCDGHGIISGQGVSGRSGEVAADGQVRRSVDEVGQVEPPVVLAMSRLEAALIIRLLLLDTSVEAREVYYRLSAKYVQAGWDHHDILRIRSLSKR